MTRIHEYRSGRRSGRSSARARRCIALVSGVVAALVLGNAAPASAQFGIVPGSFTSDTLRADGVTPETQAGAHPFQATTRFSIRLRDTGGVTGYTRDIRLRLPRGFIGNPEAAPTCSRAAFDGLVAGTTRCPAASQVGAATIVPEFATFPGAPVNAAIFNVEPRPGQTADFGIVVITVPVHIVATVDTEGDYGLKVELDDISQGIPLGSTAITLWGVPNDASHDEQRSCGDPFLPFPPVLDPCTVGVERRPFLTNPTECNGPSASTITLNSWEDSNTWISDSYTPSAVVTGCDRLRFEPRITVRSDSPRASSPAGYSVDIDIPQNDDPDGLATPPLRDAVVTMPAGTSISPSSADGLQGCADAQIALRSNAEPTCPEASKIGTVNLRTPLLGDPMVGEIYLGQPQPGNMFRLFVTLRGPGLLIKLPGTVKPDLQTGRITTTFDENPPLPFSGFHLEFKGGPRAPLSNPDTCGPATATASMTAWGVDAPAQDSSTFEITQNPDGSPCSARGFSPSFVAGLQNPVAGSPSTFSLTFARGDADQWLRDITVDMPEGVTGVIAQATECADAQASAGTCGPESLIGSATNAAGAGSNPYYLPGRVYLTGPYKGAPLGLSIVVPAVAGPFDLGTVVVRTAVHVDKRTTQLRVVSDPLPTILEGVPLQIRSVNVRIDKPGFMLSPTNCREMSVGSVISSIAGAVAARRSRFQVGNCAALRFTPRMALRVGSRGRTARGKTTPLEVLLRMGRGQANNSVVQVTLPRTLNSRLEVVNLRNSCTPEQFSAGRCPRTIGFATAVTPLLKSPLRGDIYLVQTGRRRGLPNMVVALKGQVDVDLTGRITIDRQQRVKTTFASVPDVPISSFRLNLTPGRNGAVGVVRNLCTAAGRRATVAKLAFTGQNGKRVSRDQRITVRGCGRAASRRAASRDRRASRRGAARGRRRG